MLYGIIAHCVSRDIKRLIGVEIYLERGWVIRQSLKSGYLRLIYWTKQQEHDKLLEDHGKR